MPNERPKPSRGRLKHFRHQQARNLMKSIKYVLGEDVIHA
jgi:hypothetical protein